MVDLEVGTQNYTGLNSKCQNGSGHLNGVLWGGF